jgi:hypothetical protein
MNRTRWIVTAAAGLAVVLGGSGALAATGSSSPASDFLGDVSKRLGISQDKLEGAIEDATIARIDAAVAAGDITKEQGDALKERVRSGDGPAILPGLRGPGFGPPGPPEKGSFPGVFPGIDLMETAADYLGRDGADVREALRDGKSLADLAKDEGKSVDGLEDALRDEIRKDADQAVDEGALTQAQADRIVERLGSAVDKLVEGNLRDGFDLDLRGGRGDFGFHLRIRPEDRMQLPEGRERPSFELPAAPPRPPRRLCA